MLSDINIDFSKLKRIMLYTFGFGLVAHGYCYFNSNFSHDSLYSIYVSSPKEMISIGRYFRPLYRLIRGNFAIPTLIGFLSLLFFGISIYFIVDSLNIKNKLFIFLTCGILITNYSISTLNATYIHDADSYAITLLFVTFSVWLSLKSQKYLWLSTVLFFISLGIYQAYIDVAIFIYLIIAFLNLLDGKDWKNEFITLFKRLLSIAISMVLYYLVYILIIKITGVIVSTSYNSVSQALGLSFHIILAKLNNTAFSEIYWLLKPSSHNVLLIRIINIIQLIIGLIIIRLCYSKKKVSRNNVIASLIILALMPVGMNVITLISNTYHDLTIYSFFLCYIFILKLFELDIDTHIVTILRKASIVMVCIMLIDNCVYSNEAYLTKSMEYDSTLSVFTRIIDRIEQTEGYEPGTTKVVFVGSLDNSIIVDKREGTPFGTGIGRNYSVTYYGTYTKYLNYLLGYNINIGSEAEKNELSNKLEIKEMESFPNENSVKFVDGILVVKLSD